MIFLKNKELPYKIISLVTSKNSLCFRLLTPCYTTSSRASEEELTGINSLKSFGFTFGNEHYQCTHEIFIEKNSNLWQGGNHLVIYETPDSFIEGTINICKKEHLPFALSPIILAEILCIDNYSADILVHADPKGSLYTNEEVTCLSSEHFNFKYKVSGPAKIKTNEVNSLALSMESFTGKPVNGTITVSNSSGYLPNKEILIKDGIGNIIFSSLLVQDYVKIFLDYLTLKIDITNE